MSRWLWVLALLLGMLAIGASSEVAMACGGVSDTNAASGGNAFTVSSNSANEGCASDEQTVQGVPGEWHSDPVCELGGSATCEVFMTCSDGTRAEYVYFVADDGREFDGTFNCDDGALAVTPQVTAGLVLAALRRLPLPASQLVVQPPDGRTLVNFDTNFYTEAAPFTRTIRLLGQRVDLDIWPSQFAWSFGDGQSLATQSAGSPYPDLEITHSYTTKGGVTPAVDTTYSARFRVNGGAWQPVNGTVTIPGPAVTLDVVEATPTLVGYR